MFPFWVSPVVHAQPERRDANELAMGMGLREAGATEEIGPGEASFVPFVRLREGSPIL